MVENTLTSEFSTAAGATSFGASGATTAAVPSAGAIGGFAVSGSAARATTTREVSAIAARKALADGEQNAFETISRPKQHHRGKGSLILVALARVIRRRPST